MRPISLTVEGLSCFKERQEIDFSKLELFAISGPTGAGKSSLLDAMLFALYGSLPRVDKSQIKEMISAGCGTMTVRFDFALGGARYRVTRTLKRKGGQQRVRFEHHDGDDFNVNLADKIRAANEAIRGVLGLNDEAFRQAVILPQGEFARFLKSEPRKRREMLRTLLRLEIFEEMRKRAERRAKGHEGEVKAARELLRGEYAGVSASALTRLQRENRALAKEEESLEATIKIHRTQLDEITLAYQRTRELASARERLTSLEAAAEEIDAKAAALRAAERAAALRPSLEESQRAARWLSEAESSALDAKAAQEQAEQEHAHRQRALEDARRAAAEIPGLREQIARRNRAVGRLPELRRQEQIARSRDRQIAKRTAERKAAAAALEAGEAALLAASNAVETSRRCLATLAFDGELDALLETLQPEAIALAQLDRRRDEAESERSAREATTAALGQKARLLEEQLAEAAALAATTRAELDSKQAALDAAERGNAAGHLRDRLVAGAPCPVCGQRVDAPPARQPAPEVERCMAERDEAKVASERAEEDLRRRGNALERLRGRVASARDDRSVADRRLSALSEELLSRRAALTARLGGRGPGRASGAAVVESWIEAEAKTSRSLRREHQKASQARVEAERERQERLASRQQAASKLSTLDTDLRRLEGERETAQGAIVQLRAELEALGSAGDPEAEQQELARQVAALEQKLKELEPAAEAAMRAMIATEAAKLQADSQRREAKTATEAAQARLRHRLDEAGFADADAARRSLLDPVRAAELQARVEEHGRNRHSASARVEALERELGLVRVKEAELDSARQAHDALHRQLKRMLSRRGELRQQMEAMKQRIDRAQALRAQLTQDEEQLQIYDALSKDLRSDRFQAYVLEEAFSELVAGASIRLLQLSSERYALKFDNDTIIVVDHDNAAEQRIADTLSGGETFLASLSLALELSAQVQRAAGAVPIDSLFIDEGFGTLDPETLQTVSEAIQNLPVAGRMVGVITHIPALRDEFSQQILVRRHSGGSTVEVLINGP